MRNGNGNQDLSAVATLEGRLEVFPEEILPVVHRETAAPHSDRLTEIVKLLLVELGVDVANQHFRETPERVARFYREFTGGFCVRPETILKTFRSEARELVVVSGIDFFSLCPHHLLVYGGKIHFGYIPNGQIVGVSKIPRLVHALAARPIIQGRRTRSALPCRVDDDRDKERNFRAGAAPCRGIRSGHHGGTTLCPLEACRK